MTEKELFLIYGPPGSGKTTIGKKVEQRSGGIIKYLSVGEITREEVKNQSPVGKELNRYLESVREYPPALIGGLMEKHILEAVAKGRKILVDGFPKYPAEIPYFLKIIDKNNLFLCGIVVLELSLEESLRRTNNRWICQACQEQFSFLNGERTRCPFCGNHLYRRDDDKEGILARRYKDHEGTISDTLNVLKKANKKITHIDGEASREEVLDEVLRAINMPE